MMKLLVFSLALFGSYYTHAAWPTNDLRESAAPDFNGLGRETNLRVNPAPPERKEFCLTEDEKEEVFNVLLSEGQTVEASRAAIEEFGRTCRPR